MKRLMMLVTMMAFVLLLPMTAKAAEGDMVVDCYSKTQTLTANTTVEGDLYIEAGTLDLNGYALTVNGNVYATGYMDVGDGTLIVGGNYFQKDNSLVVTNGKMTVLGDLRIQSYNAAGDYLTGEGRIMNFGSGAVFTVGGDIVFDTDGSLGWAIEGTIIAKGSLIEEGINTRYGDGVEIGKLIMQGTSEQILHLSDDSYVKELVVENTRVKVGGYLNATLGSNMDKFFFENDAFYTSNLDLNGYNMTIPGTMYAEGTVEVREGNLNVIGEYLQKEGNLRVESGGVVTVEGNLRIHSINKNGEYIRGNGGLSLYEGSRVIAKKDFVVDTTQEMYDARLAGVIEVQGNYEQISTTKFCPQYVYMHGKDKQQTITIAGNNSVIDTLELGQENKYYTFNPNPCWNTIIRLEGLVSTSNGFKYFEGGNWNTQQHKFVSYHTGLFLVANGVIATQINGLAQDPVNTDDWYYLSHGQAMTNYSGLVIYDGAWFYIDRGKLDTNLVGYVKYDTGLFYVGAGRIMKEVSGLAQDPATGEWYYLAEGQAQIQYTGLAEYDGEWFYVVNGKLAEDYTGEVEYDGAKFNVVNGMVK